MTENLFVQAVQEFDQEYKKDMEILGWLDELTEMRVTPFPKLERQEAASIETLREYIRLLCSIVGKPNVFALFRARNFQNMFLIVRLPACYNVKSFEMRYDINGVFDAQNGRLEDSEDKERGALLINLIDEWIKNPEAMKPYSGGEDATDKGIIKRAALQVKLHRARLFKKGGKECLNRVLQMACDFGYIQKLTPDETFELFGNRGIYYRRLGRQL